MFSIDPHHFLNDARVTDHHLDQPPMFVGRWVYSPLNGGSMGDGKHPPVK